MRIEKDKILHLLVGAVISLLSLFIFKSVTISILLSLVAGGLKEGLDATGSGRVELADFLYTGLGGVMGAVIFNILFQGG